MLGRIKDIALAQYIGAILIAILAANIVTGLISIIISPLVWHLAVRRNLMNSSVWQMSGSNTGFDWTTQIAGLVNVSLHFAVVLALFRWLYFERKQAPPKQDDFSDAPQGT